jgi:hypothetical protein
MHNPILDTFLTIVSPHSHPHQQNGKEVQKSS